MASASRTAWGMLLLGLVSASFAAAQYQVVTLGLVKGQGISPWTYGVERWPVPLMKPSDVIVFRWVTETHSVHQFSDVAAYAACDFSAATEVAPRGPAGFQAVRLEPSDEGKTLYYGSAEGNDCERGVRLAVKVAKERKDGLIAALRGSLEAI